MGSELRTLGTQAAVLTSCQGGQSAAQRACWSSGDCWCRAGPGSMLQPVWQWQPMAGAQQAGLHGSDPMPQI